MPDWAKAEPADVGMDAALLAKARDYALKGGGAGYIVRRGKLVFSWGDVRQLHDLKSTSKSIGVTALGLAIADGKIRLDDKAQRHHPTLGDLPAGDDKGKAAWRDQITIFQLATQTAGFEKPGGYSKLAFRPGTTWYYSDCGPNWLAECITLAYRRDAAELLAERVFRPLGIKPSDLRWRLNAYRPAEIDGIPRREFGSGCHANVDAMARIGLLYLRRGRWRDRQIIPGDFVRAASTTPEAIRGLPVRPEDSHPKASDHYGLLWWNNNDGALAEVPTDACWSWGLGDSLIVVIPSLDVVVSRAGKSWAGDGYPKLAPFLGPIAASARAGAPVSRPGGSGGGRPAADGPQGAAPAKARSSTPPCPPSPVIAGIRWAPAEQVIRQARGCDNWPITWADDDRLYAAYGDGRGFEPYLGVKLSLGLARIEGEPPAFRGVNIRSPTGEQRGDGASGRKASGLVCIRGRLYMLARNAGNAQLAWSDDHGAIWTWADWRFTTSFGCPTFLSFGRDYAGARDEYVYLYSPDSNSAYEPADRMVLARVPADRLAQRDAYEFYGGMAPEPPAGRPGGRPVWTGDIRRRAAVFEHRGRCYRSGTSYSAPLKRYLWWQVIPPAGAGRDDRADARLRGGLGVYDAPEPWGPWTTAFFTEDWDVGPGESGCFPTKWMAPDGRTMHLVFSGDDCFSVRQATVELR